jgi:hypothetical protein
MINSGKCQKCEKVITYVRIEDVDVRVGFESRWHGVSYCCPFCNSVISVQIDPIALKTDIIDGVVEMLRRKS